MRKKFDWICASILMAGWTGWAGSAWAAPIAPTDTVRDAHGFGLLALGPEENLAAANLLNSGLDYFPDEGTSLLPSPPGSIRLLVGTGSSWLLTGTGNLASVVWTSARQVLAPDTASSYDNGYAGFSGTWSDKTNRVWGIYHAEDHKNIANIPGTQIPGFYATVALAASGDSGNTWTRQGPLIQSYAPKISHDSTRTDQGAGEPGVVASPDGKWLFVDWTDHSPPNGLGARICLARIAIDSGMLQPATCRKWDGTGFTRDCLGGRDTSVLLSDSLLGGPRRGIVLEGHPAWIPSLQTYAMVFGLWPWQGLGDTSKVGTWIGYSTDMIHWGTFARVLHDNPIVVPGQSLRWEATLLPDATDKKGGWLVYGYTPKWPDGTGGRGHSMVRRHITWIALPAPVSLQAPPQITVRADATGKSPRRRLDGRVTDGKLSFQGVRELINFPKSESRK